MIKSDTVRAWKWIGLITTSKEELDEIYQRYVLSKSCELCGDKYKNTTDKCMDHEHHIGKYGWFRNIVCQSCNKFIDKRPFKNNKLQKRNITERKINGNEYWRISFEYKGYKTEKTLKKSKYSLEQVEEERDKLISNINLYEYSNIDSFM